MSIRISHPEEAIPAEIKFPNHFFAKEEDMMCLGTHFGYDVYIQLRNMSDKGYLYCVFGSDDSEYYSGVGYGLVRTNRPSEPVPAYYLAAAVALLNRPPEYTEMVLKAHRD